MALPSFSARPRPSIRTIGSVAGTVVLAVGAALSFRGLDAASAPVPASALAPLAQRIPNRSVGFALPLAWLATPPAGVAVDDLVDIVGVRRGDSASVYPLANNVRILTVDERLLVVAIQADDAAQIALARANDLLLVPLVRPRR